MFNTECRTKCATLGVEHKCHRMGICQVDIPLASFTLEFVCLNLTFMQESKISKELHRRVFELTLALYRVTDFFPQGEALRKQLREKANEIFGGVAEYGHSIDAAREALAILAKVESIRGYLEICRSMRFVRPINITVLEREYDFIANFLTKELNDTANDMAKDGMIEPLATWDEFAVREMSDIKDKMSDRKDEGLSQISQDITERQKKILEYIQQSSQAKISDFYSHFQNISSKTIQRDLQDLVSKDILKKEGEKRWTTYSLNGVR